MLVNIFKRNCPEIDLFSLTALELYLFTCDSHGGIKRCFCKDLTGGWDSLVPSIKWGHVPSHLPSMSGYRTLQHRTTLLGNPCLGTPNHYAPNFLRAVLLPVALLTTTSLFPSFISQVRSTSRSGEKILFTCNCLLSSLSWTGITSKNSLSHLILS